MKKPTDFSDTLSRSANEARGILQQTASLLEAEWKRIVDAVDGSESVPEQLKTAVDRFDNTVDDVKDFVTTNGPKVVSEGIRRARDAGVPIPEDWPNTDSAGADETPFTDGDDAVTDEVVDADLVEDEAGPDDESTDDKSTDDKSTDDKS